MKDGGAEKDIVKKKETRTVLYVRQYFLLAATHRAVICYLPLSGMQMRPDPRRLRICRISFRFPPQAFFIASSEPKGEAV